MVAPYTFRPGSTPLLVSLPHGSTHIPDPILDRMTPAAKRTPDTDWHMEQLYDFAGDMGASVIAATHSRYVVDLNRVITELNKIVSDHPNVSYVVFLRGFFYVAKTEFKQAARADYQSGIADFDRTLELDCVRRTLPDRDATVARYRARFAAS